MVGCKVGFVCGHARLSPVAVSKTRVESEFQHRAGHSVLTNVNIKIFIFILRNIINAFKIKNDRNLMDSMVRCVYSISPGIP